MTDQEREIERVISYIRSCKNAGIDATITIDKNRSHLILNALEEIKQYRNIGTAEECQEARERFMPKVPNIWGDGYDDEGNMIYDMYECPNCGKNYEIDYEKYDHCPACGQAIDWRGYDSEN